MSTDWSSTQGGKCPRIDAGALGWCAQAQLHDYKGYAAKQHPAGDPWDPLSQGTQSVKYPITENVWRHPICLHAHLEIS